MPDFSKLKMNAFDSTSWEGSKTTTTSSTRHDKNIYRIKPNKPVTVRFITDSGDLYWDPELSVAAQEDGSWVKYREVAAWEDVVSKNNPNGRVTHAFIPVTDTEMTQSGDVRDRKDPVQRVLQASDKELANPKWGKPYPQARDMLLVSVIFEGGSFNDDTQYDPEPGTLIFLALSPQQRKGINKTIQTGHNLMDNFTLTGSVWTLRWWHDTATDKGPQGWTLDVIQDREQPPLTHNPTPLDGRVELHNIRAATEQELFGLDETLSLDDEAEVVAAFEELAAQEDVADEEDVPEWDRPENKTHLLPKGAPAVNVDGDNPFKRRSPAWVKGMLKKHKVDFDPRTPNDQLYALALKNLPIEIAA